MLFDYDLAWKDEAKYQEVYEYSINNSDKFWLEQAKCASWDKFPTKVADDNGWFADGEANICYNCLDRHAKSTPNKAALIWHGDVPGERLSYTYAELLELVQKFAAILINNGIKKGDVVTIYLPMVPEAIAFMLACARIGAVHMVVFAGFSGSALAYRTKTSGAKMLITKDFFRRGGRSIDLKSNINEAVESLKNIKIINIDSNEFKQEQNKAKPYKDYYKYKHNDSLFILYTSGTTSAPKPIEHYCLGYMVYTGLTFKHIFDIKKDDVYFCTSDIGWITGHSYVAYAPFFNGITTVVFEGTPTYPSASRLWEIVEQEKVNILYTAPTAIRSLMSFGDKFVKKHDRSSLRILGSVGEPINKEAWRWYHDIVGEKKCHVVDTWWQSETGGIMIAPLLSNKPQKPAVAGKPFFGIKPVIVDTQTRKEITSPKKEGMLMIASSWPSMHKNIKARLENGMFKTGDGAKYDTDFDIKITGRLDDVLNISGHRLSAAEMEDIVNSLGEVKECAVVAKEHEIKGQSAFIYIVAPDMKDKEKLTKKITKEIRKRISPIAKPDHIMFVDDLPKTRSGKILRHILKSIANETEFDATELSHVINPESISHIKDHISEAIHIPDKCSLKKS